MSNDKKKSFQLPLWDHGKPRNRRDAIARGFMMGGSMAVLPGLLTEVLAAKAFGADCASVADAAAAERIPFMFSHFQGGENFLNAGFGITGPGGVLLNTGGYSQNGMPLQTELNNSLGAPGYTDGAFYRVFNAALTNFQIDPTAFAARMNGVNYALDTNDDTNNLRFGDIPHLVLNGINGSGGVSSTASKVADVFGISDRGARYQIEVADARVIDVINDSASAQALVDSTAAGLAFGGIPNLTNAILGAQSLSEMRFATHKIDPNLANTLSCAWQGANKNLTGTTPESLDWRAQTGPGQPFEGLEAFAQAQGARNGEIEAAFTHAHNVLNGFALTSMNQFSGHDNHGQTVDNQLARATASLSVVACMFVAAFRANKSMIWVGLTDGSKGGNNGTADARGWTRTNSDSGNKSSAVMLTMGSASKPEVISNMVGSYDVEQGVAGGWAGANNLEIATQQIATDILGANGITVSGMNSNIKQFS